MTFSPSPGQAHETPEGRTLLRRLGRQRTNPAPVMNRAYEADSTRQLALDLGFEPVVRPLKTERDPRMYYRETDRRRNEIELLFRRLKGFRCIFSRLDKLDTLYLGFVLPALIYDPIRKCEQALTQEHGCTTD